MPPNPEGGSYNHKIITDNAPIKIFPQRGLVQGRDTGGNRQQKNPGPWELDRTSRHRGGKLGVGN